MMKMALNSPTPNTMLKIDFICALTAGIAYILLFDFLHRTLGIPFLIVVLQLIANNAYGIAGVLIFRSKDKQAARFKALVKMNFIYSAVCAVLGIYLLLNEAPLGAWLLIAESVFISVLAVIEKRSLNLPIRD